MIDIILNRAELMSVVPSIGPETQYTHAGLEFSSYSMNDWLLQFCTPLGKSCIVLINFPNQSFAKAYYYLIQFVTYFEQNLVFHA